MTDRKCYYCDKDMPKGTEHIIYDNNPICMDCTEESEVTYYYIGGEYAGTDEDNITKVYAWEDQDNLEKLEGDPNS